MNFDIDAIAASAEATFDVNVGERDDGSKVGFRVVGTASQKYVAAELASRALSFKVRATENGPIDLKSDKGSMLAATSERTRQRIVVDRCVVDFFGFTKGESEPAVFSEELLKAVLDAKPNWVSLLADAIENDENFGSG